jgi:hypothetical protein
VTDIFYILNNLYTSSNHEWILELDNSMVQPFLINKWLLLNTRLTNICVTLDEYTFTLEPKEWLLLANVLIPKVGKAPFVKYIKKLDCVDDYKYKELLERLVTFLNIDGNDLDSGFKYLKPFVDGNIVELMRFFGMDKKLWKKYGLNYEDMRVETEERNVKKG